MGGSENHSGYFWSGRCLLTSLLLYCSLHAILPIPWLTVPFLTALVLRASTRQPAVLIAAAILCQCIGPPQWVLWRMDYNEAFYQDLSPSNWLTGCLLWGLGWASGLAIRWDAPRRRTLGLVVALLALIAFPWRAGMIAPSLLTALDTEPAPGYVFDGQMLLKVFHLYYKGMNYHQANLIAFQQDGRHFGEGFPGMSVRSATLCWLLSFLPSPGLAAWVGWALTVTATFAVYLASRKVADPLLSLPAVSLILCFYLYFQTNYWLFIQDPWGTLFVLLALAILTLRPSSYLVPLALGLAFAIREFDGLLLVIFVIFDLRQRNYRRLGLSLLILLLCLGLYHYNRVESARIMGMEAIPLAGRLGFSAVFGAMTLRFGSILLLGRDLWMPVLFALALVAPWLNRRTPVWLISLHAGSLGLIFFFLGNGGSFYSFNTIPVTAWAAVLGLAGQDWPALSDSQLGVA